MASFKPFPVLETASLVLRRMERKDLPDLFQMRNDPGMVEFTDSIPDASAEDTEVYLDKMDRGIDADRWIIWAIEHRPTKKVIGSASIWNLDGVRSCGELGYGIIPDFQGKGYMQEALSRVVDYAFHTMGLRAVEAFTEESHLRSRRLLEKAGFVEVDIVDDPGFYSERVYHMVVYRLEQDRNEVTPGP